MTPEQKEKILKLFSDFKAFQSIYNWDRKEFTRFYSDDGTIYPKQVLEFAQKCVEILDTKQRLLEKLYEIMDHDDDASITFRTNEDGVCDLYVLSGCNLHEM